MSPSFYRTIHKKQEIKSANWNGLAARWLQQHAVKIIVSFAVFILLFTSFLMLGTDASGNLPAEASLNEQVVTVHTGDTLWDIAKKYADGKDDDIRYIIYSIKDRNGLQSADIKPGQKLIIPAI
ncbi:MAG: cell division suppressor protein YneA [Bacillota bacterium]